MTEVSPLVSIIIPVYNVEKFLNRCMESVLGQTYENLEVILIDDGSPDGCPQICDEYAVKDSRVCVIHKKNEGQAIARNIGIDRCRGDYISFVDSDDWLEPDAIEHMVQIAQSSQVDMVIAERRFVKKDSVVCSPYIPLEGEKSTFLDDIQAIKVFCEKNWAPWARLYKKILYEGIRFPNYRIFEDEAIMFQLIQQSKRIAYTNKVIYNYAVREESTTKQQYSKRRIDGVRAWKGNLDFLEKNYPFAVDLVIGKLIGICIYNLDNLIILKEEKDVEYVLQVVKKYLKKCAKSKKTRFTLKIRVIVACCSLKMYEKIYIRRIEK